MIDTRQAQVTAVLKTENVVFPVCLTSTGTLLAGELRMSPDPSSTLGRHEPGVLRAFSTTTRELVASVELKGKFPLTMTASPDGRLGYVAGITSSEVDIVDLETWAVLNTLDIAKRGEAGAHGLAYIPRST
ncbi:Putative surface layer protein [Mycobacteroides abscessus subsp. abscessus]|nr:Putative surface layer protein [Mycobacteroides abscessus subsp. abscessus]